MILRVAVHSVLLLFFTCFEIGITSEFKSSNPDPKKCSREITTFCNDVKDSELLLIRCLMAEPLTANALSDSCHNYLWIRRVQLTQDNYFHNASNGVCNADLARVPDCRKIAEGSSEKIPCLFEHKQEVTNHECQMYLNLVGEIILSDFRLVYGFIDSCKNDIEKFNCGRVSVGPVNVNRVSVLSQGATINCLSLRIEKLDSKCAHQIFRISELQSDDFHLDRPLFYACREDRERLCGGVVSGDGRVFDCLMNHKFDEGMSFECRQHLTERFA
uniref:Golgi apparatus protein 1 n=1 Tax=Schistocephalus solidus TaxID=70667 RepID=A0A0X3PJL8_SCHSO